MADETSLKGIIQSMMSDSSELMQGTVISEDPLKIQMTNDEKLIINERITVVPRHLSDYTTTAMQVSESDEDEEDETETKDDTADTTESEDDTESEEDSEDEESSSSGSLVTLTVYNALKVGDKVYVLSLNRGKLYYVLDRVVEEVDENGG